MKTTAMAPLYALRRSPYTRGVPKQSKIHQRSDGLRTAMITGAAGFIGSHLARAMLRRGDRVIGIDNFDRFYHRSIKQHNIADLDGSRFRLFELDIRDEQAMRSVTAEHQPDVIYHVAALAGVRPSIAEPARFVSVNLDGLASVLEAARHAGVAEILFASSSSVYGNNDKVPFAEDDAVNEPISPYAATKRAGELLCRTYSHLYGLSIGGLRFFTVYGPGQRPDLAISLFMRRIARGLPVKMFGDGSSSRDYTFIDDIIAGVLSAERVVENSPRGYFRIWNLGGSSPVALRELIEAIGEVVERAPQIERLPMQPGDVEQTWADLSRSSAELGFVPQTPLEVGLCRQWQWLKPNLGLYDMIDAAPIAAAVSER